MTSYSVLFLDDYYIFYNNNNNKMTDETTTYPIELTRMPSRSTERERMRSVQNRNPELWMIDQEEVNDLEGGEGEGEEDEMVSTVRSTARDERRLLRLIREATITNVEPLEEHEMYYYYNSTMMEEDEKEKLTKNELANVVRLVLERLYILALDRFRGDVAGIISDDQITPTMKRNINRHVLGRLESMSFMMSAVQIVCDSCYVAFEPRMYPLIINMCRYENRTYRYREREMAYVIYAVQEDVKPLTIEVKIRDEMQAQVITCNVCYEDMQMNETVVITGCNHEFCSGCISGFARTRGNKSFIRCACCRADIETLTVANKTEYDAVMTGINAPPSDEETEFQPPNDAEEEFSLADYLA